MREIVRATVVAIVSFITLAHAQQGAPPPAPADAASQTAGRLPAKRVVLYKNGVGYFEYMRRGAN